MCRSDAPLSTAIFRRSLTCMRARGTRCSVFGTRSAERGFFRTHVREPAVDVGDAAVDDVEERVLQPLGDRTALAGADRDAIDRSDRRDLRGRADDEDFVGGVERLARYDRLLHRN